MDNALGSGAGDTVGAKTTRFLLSGEKSRQAFQLDDVFFQNWYGYQDEVVMNGGKFDVIQIMNVRHKRRPFGSTALTSRTDV